MRIPENKNPVAYSAIGVAQALRLKGASGNDWRARFRCCNRNHEDKHPSAVLKHSSNKRLHVVCHACGFRGGLVHVVRHLKLGYNDERARRYLEGCLKGVKRVELAVCPAASTADLVAECLPDLAPPMDDSEGRAYLTARGFSRYGAYPDLAVLPSGRARKDLVHVVRKGIPSPVWEDSPSTHGDDFWAKTHRLVMLHRAPDGTVRAAPRRSLKEDAEIRYLCPPEVDVAWPFGVTRFLGNPGGPAVVCEGALDALAYSEIFGTEPAVLGMPGADSWRDEWVQLLKGRHSVVLALDNDAAGHNGARVVEASIRKLIPSMPVERKVPSHGHDWGEELKHVRVSG